MASSTCSINGDYDWAKEVKAIDETKAGVKGLVDSGITKLPRIFVQPQACSDRSPPPQPPLDVPTIDLRGAQSGGERRRAVVEEIRKASSEWGFFRIVNHTMPAEVMEAMLAAVRRFHELPAAAKAAFYTSDRGRRVKFNCILPQNGDELACWRDILRCYLPDDQLDPAELPSACRAEVQQFVTCVVALRELLAELLSEALGLRSDYLSTLGCMKSEGLACLYYPKCPEPDKTFGNKPHTDTAFLTVVLQDDMGGLQVRHGAHWVDVPPVPGALVVNIGDLMQLISNDKFVSMEHRVVAQAVGPRVSVACFFSPSMAATGKPFAPIKELLSDESPAVYREVMFGEYVEFFMTKFRIATSALEHFKIMP